MNTRILTIYTIGHSSQTIYNFIDILEKYHINALVDIRSQPFSSHSPQFNQDVLKKQLQIKKIYYIYMGKELGARRDEPDVYDSNGQVDFIKTAQTPLFKYGINRIISGLNKNYFIAIMCTEKTPIECHRFGLVSRVLSQNKVNVLHIIDENIYIPQKELEQSLIVKYTDKIDFLFQDIGTPLDQAYRLLNKDIGYKKS